jgi:hypothetical protein
MGKPAEYIPGAPLYAIGPMKFSGVPVAPGEIIPDRPERQRRLLWEGRKATHAQPRAKAEVPVAAQSVAPATRGSSSRRGHR